jgi:hypothetical protein
LPFKCNLQRYNVYNRTTSEEHKRACAALFNKSKVGQLHRLNAADP